MRISNRYLTLIVLFLTSVKVFAQTSKPNISYSPSSYVLTQNTAMTPMMPNNSGGIVGTFGYNTTGTNITGSTLDHPYGVATDASGNVYVANFGVDKKDRGSVSKYNPASGTWTPVFATDSINNPSAIVVDNSGNVFVLNYQRNNNGNGNQDGNGYISEYNSSGILQGVIVQGLGPATGMAINNSNGNLDVAEEGANGGNAVINEYNTSGALNFTLSNANISNPVNVATDNAGDIFVLNNTPNQVVEFSSTGTYIATLPISGLTNPYGLYIDGSGNIYVSDSTGGTNTIDIYNSSGSFIMAISGLTNPQGLATDTKGVLYVSDYTNNTLTQYAPTGGYFISGKLPPGLTFNYQTGVVSGTPTTTFAATTYTITAYNSKGSSSTTITLSCTGNSQAPTISYTPSVQVITINTLDTLYATTTNSPITFTSSPSLPSGVTFSSTGNILVNNVTTISAATVYTITAKNAAGLIGTTTISLAFVADNYWTGKQDYKWSNKQNWSAKTVPTGTTLASIGVINYTGPDPIISSVDGNQTVGYLVLGAANAATVTVNSGYSLTVNNILQVNTNATPILAGSGKFNIVPAGKVAVLGTGNLTINSGTTFVLQSSASSSASVAAISSSGSINGQVTVQRYMSAYRGYRLMSSPVYAGYDATNLINYYGVNYLLTNTVLTGTGFPTTTSSKPGNPTLYLYRENLVPQYTTFLNSNFIGIANINTVTAYGMNDSTYPTTDIPVGDGYLFYYRGSVKQKTLAQLTTAGAQATNDTLNAVGYLNQGSITVHDWYTPSSANLGYTTISGTPTIEGSNLVGNPYACSIDWDQYGTGGITHTSVGPFCYQLVLSGQGTGNYNVYQANSVSKVGTQGNTASNIIASGQGFFVFATGTGASLTFTENAKTLMQNTGTNLYMSSKKNLAIATVSNQFLRMQMAMDTVNTDGIIIRFNNNANTGFSPTEDAMYRTGTGKVSLSSVSSDNVPLAINQLPLTNGVTIPLKVGASAYGNYTLKLADVKEVPQLFDIWLKDAFTGDSVNMRNTATYSFTIAADTSSYGTKRFSIIMRENPALAYQLLTFTASKIDNNKQVQLNWTTKNEENYTNFTLERSTDNGKTFEVLGGMTGTGAGAYGLVDKSPVAGYNVYRLKQEDINGAITYSKVIDVMYVNTDGITGNLVTYPNPVKNTLNLLINRPTAGAPSYSISIINASGLIIQQSTTTLQQWQGDVNSFLPGTYVVQVVDNKSKDIIGRTRFVKL
jgi:hypothetical protein